MRFALFASILLHLAIVGAMLADLFPMWRRDVSPEPYIPLELISEAELALQTSVPAARKEPEPVVEEPEPDLPEPVVEEQPEPPAPQEEPEPEPEPEPVIPEPAPEPKPEPPKETPKPKPQPKKDELDFDALSKLIDKEKESQQPKPRAPSETSEVADQDRPAVGAGDRLTASDEAKVRAALVRCWNASAIIGAPEPEKLIVVIDFELNRDGSLASQPRVANSVQINLSGNRFWKVAEREAIAAVNKCAPYDFLSPDRYESWKEFRLTFDPSQMAGF